MAATKKAQAAAAARAKAAGPKPEVSRAEFDALVKESGETNGAVSRILDLLEAQAKNPGVAAAPAVAETPDVAAVPPTQSAKATPNRVSVNPEWDEIARDILGPALDHTEVEHEKSGGIKFTIVVAEAYSNADQSYLERMKVDRRTKEVSQDGVGGVEEWCRQVKANLARTLKVGPRQ